MNRCLCFVIRQLECEFSEENDECECPRQAFDRQYY